MTISATAAPGRSSGRLLLLLGVALAVLGVVGYVVQLRVQHLTTPWYMPCAATLGVACVAASLVRRRSIWRVLALVLMVLVAGAEWALLLVALRLPPYTGPVAAGRPFPAFTTARADGTPFTQYDLQGGPDSVLVFFRGRW
jgi:hypothetical protein